MHSKLKENKILFYDMYFTNTNSSYGHVDKLYIHSILFISSEI